VEPVEEVEEGTRERNSERTLAPLARYTDLDEKGPVEEDSFTKLLAEIDWEIEEEVDIEFGNQLDLGSDRDCSVPEREVAGLLLGDEWDVRTDHPTSALGECCEEVLPTEFSRDTQEVPDGVAERVPKGLTSGIPLPAAGESHRPANNEEEKEDLYTAVTTPADEDTPTVDNDEVQKVVNLQEVFFFHACDGTTVQDTPDDETEQDMMMTDETFPIYDDGVADALTLRK